MFDTFGFDEFIDALGDLEEDFKREATKLLEETGDLAVAETQARTPVDSGTLRQSMVRSDVAEAGNDMKIEVGTNIEYAEFVEEGHKTRNGGFIKGRHMLKNGVAIAQKRFENKAKGLFKSFTDGFEL